MTALEDETPSAAFERGYIQGSTLSKVYLLRHLLGDLRVDVPNDPLVLLAIQVAERAETVAKLREICAIHGDNDWPDDAHLTDVLEHHLWCHLQKPEDEEDG